MNDTVRDNFVIDWVANNIYYIDSTMHTINVARHDGQHKKLLVDELMEPLAIAVYPRRGYENYLNLSVSYNYIGCLQLPVLRKWKI